MVRLIRLIRLMKLYKMTTARSETDQEDRLKEEARTALNAKQAALKRVEASRLGKQLSDMITRIVILGILLVLICLPLIKTSVVTDNSRYFAAALQYRNKTGSESTLRFGYTIEGRFRPATGASETTGTVPSDTGCLHGVQVARTAEPVLDWRECVHPRV